MKSRSNEKPRHGLAVTSLVLGIVSVLCGGLVTGIPAIITGRLAARIYANDHGGTLPGSLVQMSNELGSALFLVCPFDPKAPPRRLTARPITETDYLSYEWLAKPGEAGSDNSQNVLVRCRVDGNLLLRDGSVRRGSDKQ